MAHSDQSLPEARPEDQQTGLSEDWLAIWIGGALLALFLATVLWFSPPSAASVSNPWANYLDQPDRWADKPWTSLLGPKHDVWAGVLGALAVSAIAFSLGARAMGRPWLTFLPAFSVIFLLATLAFLMAEQQVVNDYNLEYALWALVLGLLISNTISVPRFLRPALCTEFYIKTGLVLLGAEILFGRLLVLGLPGIFVAWIVTPTVLITTFWFGQRILKIESPSLNMVISADMSVCGVSAAIATAAACRAKKEELSLAIGMSLTFTVVMMVVLPEVVEWAGMGQVLGGAWIGGTIDSTGAVAAAGAMLGEDALQVAATVKMIQNILIGVIAFGVAVYWTAYMEPSSGPARFGAMEIWYRFPKFILGFIGASLVFSLVYGLGDYGEQVTDAVLAGSKTLRGWFFCLAFVSIGLETEFRRLAGQLGRGKPLVLYVAGQSLNLSLTLFMAWLMFEKVFPEATKMLEG